MARPATSTDHDESTQDLRERATDLRDRATDMREQMKDRAGELTERARERAEVLRQEAEAAIPPAAHKAQLGLWQGVRGLATVLAILPRLLIRVLQALSAGLETLFAQAEDAADRGQKLARRLPEPRALRRRHRRELILWTTGGFLVGAGVGYLVAQRRRQPAPPEEPWDDLTVDVTSPADPRASVVE